jgi:hypothetical protein
MGGMGWGAEGGIQGVGVGVGAGLVVGRAGDGFEDPGMVEAARRGEGTGVDGWSR